MEEMRDALVLRATRLVMVLRANATGLLAPADPYDAKDAVEGEAEAITAQSNALVANLRLAKCGVVRLRLLCARVIGGDAANIRTVLELALSSLDALLGAINPTRSTCSADLALLYADTLASAGKSPLEVTYALSNNERFLNADVRGIPDVNEAMTHLATELVALESIITALVPQDMAAGVLVPSGGVAN